MLQETSQLRPHLNKEGGNEEDHALQEEVDASDASAGPLDVQGVVHHTSARSFAQLPEATGEATGRDQGTCKHSVTRTFLSHYTRSGGSG